MGNTAVGDHIAKYALALMVCVVELRRWDATVHGGEGHYVAELFPAVVYTMLHVRG